MKHHLYTRLVPLVAFTLAMASCNTLKESADPRYAATYLSYPNGMADIRLELKENARFEYQMNIFPEPDNAEGDTVPEQFTFKGRWGNTEDNYILRFRRRNKPDLYALANPGYEPSTEVVVTDERTLRFPLYDEEVVIWGVKCFREKSE